MLLGFFGLQCIYFQLLCLVHLWFGITPLNLIVFFMQCSLTGSRLNCFAEMLKFDHSHLVEWELS